LTGEYVGTIDLGDMTGANAHITADDAGNLVISSYQEAGVGLRIARMKGIDGTPEVFFTNESKDYGKDLSVVGDVYGDAIMSLMYSPWSTGTTGHWTLAVNGGVVATPAWTNVTAASADIYNGNFKKLENNNGDVIYRSVDLNGPKFMSGYSSNSLIYIENGNTAVAGH
jgi:hypothetical protein